MSPAWPCLSEQGPAVSVCVCVCVSVKQKDEEMKL